MASSSAALMPAPGKLLIAVDDLPSLPETLAEILRVANSPDATVNRVESIVSRDVALAARVLKVANSVIYGSRSISSIYHAVRLLGLNELKAISASLAVAPTFRAAAGSLVDGVTLWQHSLCTALWTQQIATKLGFARRDELFTAGLLHDVGLVVLAKMAGRQLDAALQLVLDGTLELTAAEQQVMGMDHAGVGALVCTKWKLPPALVTLVEHHHATAKGSVSPGAAILRLAEHFAGQMGLAEFPWTELPGAWNEELLADAGMSQQVADELLGNSEKIRAVVDELLRS